MSYKIYVSNAPVSSDGPWYILLVFLTSIPASFHCDLGRLLPDIQTNGSICDTWSLLKDSIVVLSKVVRCDIFCNVVTQYQEAV
jgi:hypothetical protein